MHITENRLLSIFLTPVFLLGLVLAPTSWAQEKPGWSFDSLGDLRATYGNAIPSWTQGGLGKFRTGEDDDQTIAQAFFSGEYNFSLGSSIRIEGAALSDPDSHFGVTQAFWEYKPLSKSLWRSTYKVGVFHSPFSMEHTKDFWLPRYSISPSLINSWIGEEIRTIGGEGRWTWRPTRTSRHRFGFTAAIYKGNDPAGSMLAWRGWSAHDRQTFLGETYDLAPLPVIQDGAPFSIQAPEFEPFTEVDGKPGYYTGLSWDFDRTLSVRYHYYDNRGDPLAIVDGQYAWDTRFHHLGIKWKINNKLQLISQATLGNTVMGPGAVDNDFSSAYVMLTQSWKQHRFTVRVEQFRVRDRDFLQIIDPNNESGSRISLSYSFDISENIAGTLEANQLRTRRDYYQLFNINDNRVENQITAQFRIRL